MWIANANGFRVVTTTIETLTSISILIRSEFLFVTVRLWCSRRRAPSYTTIAKAQVPSERHESIPSRLMPMNGSSSLLELHPASLSDQRLCPHTQTHSRSRHTCFYFSHLHTDIVVSLSVLSRHRSLHSEYYLICVRVMMLQKVVADNAAPKDLHGTVARPIDELFCRYSSRSLNFTIEPHKNHLLPVSRRLSRGEALPCP